MRAETVMILITGRLSALYTKQRAGSKCTPVLAACSKADLSPWRQVASCLHGQVGRMLHPCHAPLLRTLHAPDPNVRQSIMWPAPLCAHSPASSLPLT